MNDLVHPSERPHHRPVFARSQETRHRSSNSSPATRERMTNELVERFRVDEQAVLVSNGLSTDIVCFPSDLLPKNKELLGQVIWDGMSHGVSFCDVQEFNALQYIPGDLPGFNILRMQKLALGLYLAMEDQFSMHCADTKLLHGTATDGDSPHVTFLTALREKDVRLSTDQNSYEPGHLFNGAMSALRLVGLAHTKRPEGKYDPEKPTLPSKPVRMTQAEQMLWDWHQKGEFTVNGERNYVDEEGKLHGAYARLAEEISADNRGPALNRSVSFALANNREIKNWSGERVHAYINNLTHDGRAHAIDTRIARGNYIRAANIRTCAEHELKDKVPNLAGGEFARSVLSYLPDNLLEILHLEGNRIAYADHGDIGKIYPEKNLPGVSDKSNERLRKSKGLRQILHKITFLSHGWRLNEAELKSDPSLKPMIAAQSLIHELTHAAMPYMSGETRAKLRDDVLAIHHEMTDKIHDGGVKREGAHASPQEEDPAQTQLQLLNHDLPSFFMGRHIKDHFEGAPKRKREDIENRLRILDDRSASDSLDYNSVAYASYMDDTLPGKHATYALNASASVKWEEVVCDVAGLHYTEWSPGKIDPAKDPHHYLPSLARLEKDLEDAFDEAVIKSREFHERRSKPTASIGAAIA